MFMTRVLLSKVGWRPRSVGVPGRQWIGKHRRIRPVTAEMKRNQRKLERRIAQVEQMTEFPYLTSEEAQVSEEILLQQEEREKRLKWQKRILGPDVYGLGAGKPSHLDHLRVSERQPVNWDNS